MATPLWHRTRGGPSLMSETEISETPEGPPPEEAGRTSPPARPAPAPAPRKPKIGDTRPARPAPAPPAARRGPPAPPVPPAPPAPPAPGAPDVSTVRSGTGAPEDGAPGGGAAGGSAPATQRAGGS